VATGSEVEVIPPQDLFITSVDFTPDGEHVVFNRTDNRDSGGMNSIFRVPTLGGEVRRLVFDADGLPSFAPDGQQFAFRRGIVGRGVALVVADADGSRERELAIGEGMGFPAWSPDGRTIAAVLRTAEGWRLFAFDVETGSRRAVADDILFSTIGGLAWLPAGDGLVVSGSIPGGAAGLQIWRLSIDEGTLQRITNDPNSYGGISLSADGKVLATVLRQSVGHLFVAPADEPDSIRQLTHGSRERVSGVAANDSSVVFVRTPDGQKWELWACDHDGNDQRRLNTDGSEVVRDLWGISAVGGQIFFTAKDAENIDQIWRIDGSGTPPLQVTATENGAYGPSLAPDGTWLGYTVMGGTGLGSLGSAGVWRQPAGGGDPVLLAAGATSVVISPDGENVAIQVFRPDDHGDLHTFLEVIPAEGGAPVISIRVSVGGWVSALRWQPDGQAVTYRVFDNHLWLQPLDGGQPKQLTHFDHGRTLSHAWSPDGKWLYLVREESTNDAVLIRDF
jgi:Tol biopolymer transport system component